MSRPGPLRLNPAIIDRLRALAAQRTIDRGERVTMASIAELIILGEIPALPELEEMFLNQTGD